jgi:hypothetical protein
MHGKFPKIAAKNCLQTDLPKRYLGILETRAGETKAEYPSFHFVLSEGVAPWEA